MRRFFDSAVVWPLAVVVLVVVGGVLRLVVAGQDLFADELSTYWVVTAHGLSGVVRTVSTTAEITPPLSFVLSWVTSRLGDSAELIRLPALVAGIAAIPLVYAVGVRTVGRVAALLAAALTTLSPFMIYYSSEARGYGVLMAFVLVSTLALLVAVDGGRWPWWVVYAVFVCASMYTHYTAVFVLAGQLGWASWVHPRARRPLLIATSAAVVGYLPWLSGLKGDMDSPTTDILSVLSPMDLESIRLTLGHWSIGFPASSIGVPLPFASAGASLQDLPGVPALVLLVASLGVGACGIFTRRSQLGEWFAAHGGHVGLVVLLALATPVGTALQSAVGTNVFRTRSLAASWPYLALAVAALITVGAPALRVTAVALAVVAFGFGAAKVVSSDFQRPDYSRLARFADRYPGAVVVDGAAFTPGPLTNFDVEGSTPRAEVLRLNAPEQRTTPFAVWGPRPDPAEVARRAAMASGDRPIIVIANTPPLGVVEDFIDQLPPGYRLTDTERAPGLFELEALVYERRAAG